MNSIIIKEAMTRNIIFEYDAESFITSDSILLYGSCLEKYKLPDNLPMINGLHLCNEDDISDFMNNDNRITFINNKKLPIYFENKQCDMCREYVYESYYHSNNWIDPTNNEIIYDFDICLACNIIYPSIIHNSNAYLINNNNIGLENFLQWIPLYKDDEFNGLLYNCNKNSTNYGKYAIWVCDNNERIGINIINNNIQSIKNEVEQYYIEWVHNEYNNYISTDESYYNRPLMKMTSIRKLSVHFE